MPTIGFEVAHRRIWGAVKHGAMRVWHCGPVSIWWAAGQVSDELERDAEALRSARCALRNAVLAATGSKVSD